MRESMYQLKETNLGSWQKKRSSLVPIKEWSMVKRKDGKKGLGELRNLISKVGNGKGKNK